MGKKLSFVAAPPAEPIEIEIGGTTTAGEPWVETFHANADMPAGQVFEFEKLGADMQRQAAEMRSAVEAGGEASVALGGVTERAFLPFFEQALVAGDFPRFRALLDDWRNRPVGVQTLYDMMQGLIEAVADDRPTPPSPSSSNGRGTTRRTSGRGSSSRPALPAAASPTSP
jgi:hypothetical protein